MERDFLGAAPFQGAELYPAVMYVARRTAITSTRPRTPERPCAHNSNGNRVAANSCHRRIPGEQQYLLRLNQATSIALRAFLLTGRTASFRRFRVIHLWRVLGSLKFKDMPRGSDEDEPRGRCRCESGSPKVKLTGGALIPPSTSSGQCRYTLGRRTNQHEDRPAPRICSARVRSPGPSTAFLD
jgi:hypothetical protein